MSGLTATYINWKMTAEGTTATTKAIILDFLNAAPNAATIAGIEPSEGPVVDEIGVGYGDQVRDYDIGITVAQRIINKRTSLGGFTNLTQLSNIKGFGQDKFNDLLYSFSKTVHEISAIQFNFNTSTITNDALNIRKNYSSTSTLQLVFKGTIGNETDNAIAVGMKNLAEPTHLTFWNSSDMFNLQYAPYTGPTYALYTYQQLEQQAPADTNFLNYIDLNHSGILSDDLILQPYDSTFTISFWDGYDWITATTVNIPQARHIRMIAVVNSETTNYVKMDFTYPGGSSYVWHPFQGAKYSAVPSVKTFRKRKAEDRTFVPFYQHFSRTVIGCYPAQGVDANGNAASCPYSDDQARPIENVIPVSFTSELN